MFVMITSFIYKFRYEVVEVTRVHLLIIKGKRFEIYLNFD